MNISVKKITQLTGHQGAIFTLLEGHIPPYFISGAGEGWLVEWDLTNPEVGKLIAKIETTIFSTYFLKEKNVLIVGNRDGGVHFVDLNDASKTKNIAHHKKGVFSIQVIDNQIITLGGEGIITKWDIDSFKSIESYHLSSKSLRCMDYSVERNEIAIGASDGNIYFLNTQFELLNILEKAHDNSIFTIKYAQTTALNGSTGNSFLLSGGRDAHLKSWNMEVRHPDTSGTEGVALQDISAHWYTINALVFHPKNPALFATASRDKTIKIWHINTEGAITLLKVIDTIRSGCHTHSVNALHWSRFNNYLISASDDRTIIIWDIKCEV